MAESLLVGVREKKRSESKDIEMLALAEWLGPVESSFGSRVSGKCSSVMGQVEQTYGDGGYVVSLVVEGASC